MKVLVTGGYGFIGSHVAERFFKYGCEVCILDNLSAGNADNINFRHKFYKMDIEDEKCGEVFKSNKFDVVVHLAAQASVQASIEDPCLDSRTNIMGLTNILKLSVKYGVKKFVFASSAAIYGDNQDIPLSEDVRPEPLSPYGISKAAGELYCRKWNEMYGLDTVCFRFSDVYGPRQSNKGEGGVVSDFLQRISEGSELVIYGDGEQTRDFIYVEDVADAIFHSVKNDISGVFNLSTNAESSINELVEILGRQCTVKGVSHRDPRPGEIRRTCLENSKVVTLLDWTPRYTFSEGIAKTCEWYLKKWQESKNVIKKEKRTLHLKRFKLLPYIENIAAFLVLCLLTVGIQGGAGLQLPDFKMLYVLLIAIVHGTKQAILAAVMASILLIASYVKTQNEIISLVSGTEKVLQLFIYLLIGLVIGYVIDKKNYILKASEAIISSLEEKNKFIYDLFEETVKVKNEMAEQIISTNESFGKIYSLTRELDSFEPEEVFSNGVKILESTMKSDKVAIYILTEPSDFAILTAKSQNDDFNVPKILKIDERPDIKKVVEEKTIFVNRGLDPDLPVITAPVIENGKVIAIASIYSARFENLTLHRHNLFKITVDMISTFLSHAYAYINVVRHASPDIANTGGKRFSVK